MKLRIDGRTHEVDSRVDTDTLTLTVDGRTTTVAWRRDADDTLVLVVDGRARRVARVATAAAEVLPDRVTPPMPAVVVKVLVNVGDTVARGDRLVVVSAMKTETALKAPRDGVVAAVRCVVGQNVRPGDELVTLADAG